MNQITTVGVDLAKDVIVVCTADAAGRVLFFKQFSFHGFGQWAATLVPCTIGMEACGSAHHWVRRLAAFGHTAHLIAAEFVQPFRKSQGTKNDRNDAQAILIAVRQPDMRFVSVKSIDQQAMLTWHRMRKGWSDERTALISRIRGLLAEFGVPLSFLPSNPLAPPTLGFGPDQQFTSDAAERQPRGFRIPHCSDPLTTRAVHAF